MATAPSSLALRVLPPASHRWQPAGHASTKLFLGHTRPRPSLVLPRPSLSVAFARRKNKGVPKSKKLPKKDDVQDNIDEDAFEALFSLLEEDLKNDKFSDDDFDDELTEEDLARLEQELEEALGDAEISGLLDSNVEDKNDEDEDSNIEDNNVEDEDDEGDEPVKLKTWQLRRLASALKVGKRNTSIKSLAAELGLDRALVLELLREPPPELLLMSASLPDKVVPAPSEPETKPVQLESEPNNMDLTEPAIVTEPNNEVKEPIFVMQNRWSAQKRLKKVQIGTLEKVYSRTRRPTNAMIGNIVHLTNLPRKIVVKWFEDKRGEDGVPNQRVPFRRNVPEVIS